MNKYMININYVKDGNVIELFSTKFLTRTQAFNFLDDIDDFYVDENELMVELITYDKDGYDIVKIEHLYGE